jgi:hypothetical protein
MDLERTKTTIDFKDEIIQQLRDQIAFLTSLQIQQHHETMRDRLAIASLPSLMVCYPNWPLPQWSKYAYKLADAMLEERKKEIE